MNLKVTAWIFIKYVVAPLANFMLSLCVLVGGIGFIAIVVSGGMVDMCSDDGISCYSFSITMALASLTLVIGVLIRICVSIIPTLRVYKKKLYWGLALGGGKIEYFVDPMNVAKEIYLDDYSNLHDCMIHYLFKLFYFTAKYSIILALIALIPGVLVSLT